jgi:hypothetical protein
LLSSRRHSFDHQLTCVTSNLFLSFSQIIPPHDAGIAESILKNLQPWSARYFSVFCMLARSEPACRLALLFDDLPSCLLSVWFGPIVAAPFPAASVFTCPARATLFQSLRVPSIAPRPLLRKGLPFSLVRLWSVFFIG